MHNFPNTPELLIGRNDSKNPSTTCKGITTAGRPCRRSLASQKALASKHRETGGVVTFARTHERIPDAQFFCWQHRDQANDLVRRTDSKQDKQKNVTRPTDIITLRHASSIDTLMQRLDITSSQQDNVKSDDISPTRIGTKPAPNRNIDAPQRRIESRYPTFADEKNYGKSEAQSIVSRPSFWRSLCCMAAGDDDDRIEIVRHRTRVNHDPAQTSSRKPPHACPEAKIRQSEVSYINVGNNRPQAVSFPGSADPIPRETPYHIRSSLFAEMTKPLSQHDEEGYIYMFWLTPSSRQRPGDNTAQSLLGASELSAQYVRRVSDVMNEYSTRPSRQIQQKTVLLKIGRASNVTRRMHEWQRQCGHELSLVRWYPYRPSSAGASPQPSPNKRPSKQPFYPDLSKHALASTDATVQRVPCVKRVERLIHLELADQQVHQQCTTCGREHREWFQVAASEQGIRRVDGIIRRWIAWSQDAGTEP